MAEYIDREKIREETCKGCANRIGKNGCGWPEPCWALLSAFLNAEAESVTVFEKVKFPDENHPEMHEDPVGEPGEPGGPDENYDAEFWGEQEPAGSCTNCNFYSSGICHAEPGEGCV